MTLLETFLFYLFYIISTITSCDLDLRTLIPGGSTARAISQQGMGENKRLESGLEAVEDWENDSDPVEHNTYCSNLTDSHFIEYISYSVTLFYPFQEDERPFIRPGSKGRIRNRTGDISLECFLSVCISCNISSKRSAVKVKAGSLSLHQTSVGNYKERVIWYRRLIGE